MTKDRERAMRAPAYSADAWLDPTRSPAAFTRP